jgi:uncharacterized protein (UPF0261 family)
VAEQQLTVAVIATLDTKGAEALLLADLIRRRGANVMIIDTGIREHAGLSVTPDVTNDDVARACGTDIEAVRALGSRGEAIGAMANGLAVLLRDEYEKGRFQRAVVIGGLNGALLGSSGLQSLPFGVPKLIITPVASGARKFAPFVGTSDVTVMHSVVDMQGVNSFTRTVLNRAAASITGPDLDIGSQAAKLGAVAVTMNGNTTPVGMQILGELDRCGWDVVAFHSNGVGGSSMERLAGEGRFAAVVDLTTNEVADRECGGVFPGPSSRLRSLAGTGLPIVFVPGCMDFINMAADSAGQGRLRTRHSPDLDLVRVTADEARKLARIFAESVNLHRGPVEVVAPTGGFSPSAAAGGPLEDPAADAAFLATLAELLDPRIPLAEVPAPINDPRVAKAVLDAFARVTGQGGNGQSGTTLGC